MTTQYTYIFVDPAYSIYNDKNTLSDDSTNKMMQIQYRSKHPFLIYSYIVFVCTILILTGFQICVEVKSSPVAYMLLLFGFTGAFVLTAIMIRFLTSIFVICIFRGE